MYDVLFRMAKLGVIFVQRGIAVCAVSSRVPKMCVMFCSGWQSCV